MQRSKNYITRLTISRLFPLATLLAAIGIFSVFITAQSPAEKYQKAKEVCENGIWEVWNSPGGSGVYVQEIKKPYESSRRSIEDVWYFACTEHEALKKRDEIRKMESSLAFILLPLVAIAIDGMGLLWWFYEEVGYRRKKP